MDTHFIVANIVCLLFAVLISRTEGGECVYISEAARVPCDLTTESSCNDLGCCWDGDSSDNNLRCYQPDCKAGYFGWGCHFQCNCKDRRPCNRTTGECPTGCPEDSWGTGCILDNSCAYNDNSLEFYVGHETVTERGHTCGSWTKQRAYPGNQFPDGSVNAAGNFCRNPKPLDYKTWCYYWEGNVKEWDYCKINKCVCPPGRFSTNCLKECHCHDRTESCGQTTGQCRSGCDSRWMGTDCQACSDGYFGALCGGMCHCRQEGEACNKTSGVCASGCAKGWTGDSCQSECLGGWYGHDCASQCNCANSGEACDKQTGSCVSGCRDGYSGDNCQIEVPVMTRAPTTTRREATALSVTWLAWRNPPDRGDGPVGGYFLYYREVDETEWTSLREDDRFAQLTDLKQDTGYQFKVLAIHQEGFYAFASPILNTSTCGKPQAGPDNLDLRAVDMTRSRNEATSSTGAGELSMAWRLPRSPALWGCDSITKYKVYYKQTGAPVYDDVKEVRTTSIILPNMDVYRNYTVAVSLVNSAGLESDLSVAYYVGKAGPVTNIAAEPESPNVVVVTWDPPDHNNANILYYVVRYRELQIGNCPPKVTTWTPKVDLDPDQREFRIQDLQPFSQYGIRVWAHTDAGKGQVTMVSVLTTSTDPSAPIVNLEQRSITSEYAAFSWGVPPCETHHGGYEGFRYELTERSTGLVVRQEVVNQTELELRGLVPYTEYSIRISFLNDAYEGPMCDPLAFSTYQDKPPEPTNLHVVSATSRSLSLAWSAPYPPHGVLEKYDVRYWSMKSLKPQMNATVDAPNTVYIIEDLLPNNTYGVEVRAYTTVGPGPWTHILHGYTDEDVPGAPSRFQNVSRSATSITFRWGPPLQPNGVLRTYKILCSPLSMLGRYLAHDLEKEVPRDTLDYQVTGLRSGTGYTCTLRAATRKGYGPPLRKVFYTEPQAPSAPFVPELQAAQSTDTTVTIRIHPSELRQVDKEHTVSVYRIVVEELEDSSPEFRARRTANIKPCGLDNGLLLDYQRAQQLGQSCYVAAEISDVSEGRDFIIGDNRTYGTYYNAPLEKGGLYGVWYGLVLTVDGVSSAAYAKINEPVVVEFLDKNSAESSMAFAGAAIGAIVAVIILIVVVVLLLYKKKAGRNKMEERSQVTDTDRLEGSSGLGSNDRTEKVYLPDMCGSHVEDELTYGVSETSPLCDGVVVPEIRRKPILVDNLWSYVQEKKPNPVDGLKQEYDEIPMGLQHICEIARKPENKFKNRYGNIVAYDHSRVILTCTDDPTSDYINANFIDGYCKPNAFIATQGPSKYTLNDIWRMAWQQDSRRIVMVTNLVEDGRHKCEQYWPDSGEPHHYDDVVVVLIDAEQFADFVIRTFTMSKDGITKTLHQFHFTAWPDHGVPTYATSLLTFRKKVRSLDDPTVGPTIVHCSAGVGRTGTYIAIDYLLDQAKVEGQVDIYHFVQSMRAKRVNMVQTQEQYEFVYDALLEALKSGDTSISCNTFRRKYKQLLDVNPDTGRVRLEEEYELLGTMLSTPEGAVCRDALTPENVDKNRFKDIVPIDNMSRAYLLTYVPDSTDYINAVFVDGYKQRDTFIITQMPLPRTVADFWALIYDQDCRTIIMMNELDAMDTTCACYYPQDVGSENFGPFSIETISIDTSTPEVITRDLSLTYNKRGSNETRFIRHFQFVAWPVGGSVPDTQSSFITLLGLVEKWQQRSGNNTIITHCMDGATRSGLYCAVSYMVERLKVEQEVDVFQSVRHTRLNRPQIVTSLEQYRFVYDMAIEYMNCFETYSNFK